MRRLALMAWIVAAGATLAHFAAAADDGTQWRTYGHDKGQMRFSPLAQITPANVGNLQPAWTYRMRPPGVELYTGPRTFGRRAEAAGATRRRYQGSEVTPLVVDGLMYLTTPYERIVALDATTGREVWSAPGSGSTRGLEYWAGDARHAARIIYADGGSLYELDAGTGKPVAGFGVDGVLAGKGEQSAPSTSPPIVYRNLIISGAANPNGDGRVGDVRAFDVLSGRQVWRFATVPEKGQKYYDTWAPGSADARQGVYVWGLMSVDEARGLVYFPVKAPIWDRFGGERHGDNLFSSSIVALDAATGRYRWHFQIVHHDIWDFDPGAPPLLMDVRLRGRTIPAIAITSKSGYVFLLDRRDGKPIYGVEERPVPASDVPGEQTSPTQPAPVKPAPIARQTLSMADIATLTPELEAACRALVEKYQIGMGGPYLPPGWHKPTVNFPGTIGSANWGGMSFNPELGLLFVNSHDVGQITGMYEKGAPREVIGVAGAGAAGLPGIPYDMGGLLGRFRDPQSGLLCQQPPWGSLTAVNVNTGEIAWRSTLGVTDSLPADKQNTGRPNLGGSIATAGGLVFIGATDDGRFRAFDARTGQEVWTTKLSAPNHSVPVTYLGRDGRQYVALPATGGGFLEDPATDDAIVAFALPVTPPAPVLGGEVDTDGRPLPFGRRLRQPESTPFGSGPYQAVMATEASLPAHVLYHPADLRAAGKLPVIAWGNGACINAGNRFRDFLTEIASHGYLVIANGVMAAPGLEVGPQENPAVRRPGEARPPPVITNNAQRAPGTTTAAQLTESLDWAERENARRGSPWYRRLDTSRMAVMGQSCGGVQALAVAADPRLRTMMIWNSGVGMIPNNPPDPGRVLASIHVPIAFIHGDEAHDIAFSAGTQNAREITQVPVFGAWQDGMTHLGTYGAVNGGFFAQIAVAWLDWQLKGRAPAAAMFRGADCRLCRDPSWHVTKRGID